MIEIIRDIVIHHFGITELKYVCKETINEKPNIAKIALCRYMVLSGQINKKISIDSEKYSLEEMKIRYCIIDSAESALKDYFERLPILKLMGGIYLANVKIDMFDSEIFN